LAATGVWAFAPYLANEIAAQAFVNAPLVRITSPIAGTASASLPESGSYIVLSRKVRLVTARSLDSDPLGALLGQHAALKAALALARQQLAELTSADRRLLSQANAFESASIERLVASTVAARADTRACAAEAAENRTQLARVLVLSTKGFASNATVERARTAVDAGEARCSSFSARADLSAGEAAAARKGIYLGNGGMETPYSEQQRDRLMLRRQELTMTAVDAEARLADLAERIAAGRQQLARAAAYDVVLPSASVVWQVAASPGSSLSPGSPILDMVDCTRRFVSVSLPERRIESIRTGQAVRVRLIGANDWQTGRVVGAVGAAARRDTAMVAAAEPDREGRTLTVEVALPPPPAAAVTRRCDVGRLAEVRFPRWTS
jgi:multidrug resistance efflux pump